MPTYLYRIQPVRPEMLSEGPTAEEARITTEHFDYLKRLLDEGVLVLAGRTLNEDYSAFGIGVFNARDDEEMRQIVREDPGVAQKLFRAEWHPFRIALHAQENTEEDCLIMDSSPRHIVAASALIRNANGEIALVRTERRGWELPGGQVELGESLIDGVKREVYEECGLQVEIERLLQVRSNLSSLIVIFCFQASYISGELRGSPETPEVRWADPQTAQALITHPALRLSIGAMLANDAGVQVQAYRTKPFELVETRDL